MNNSEILDYTQNDGFHVVYKFKEELKKKTPYGELVIGSNNLFGYLMFFDGEIQITTSDYRLFHDGVASRVGLTTSLNKLNVLVVGDGDGGFTKYGITHNVTYVERDQDIIDAGKMYFYANFNTCKVHKMGIEDYLLNPVFMPDKYDVILLMVTDCFMRSYKEKMLVSLWSRLNRGGVLYVPSACTMDFNYKETTEKTEGLIKQMLNKDKRSIYVPHSMYIPGYFSRYNAFVITKGK